MKLIGQNNLKENINNLIKLDKFPQVCTILGRRGFGKTSLINYICEELNITDIRVVKSIDEVRESILDASNISHKFAIHIISFEDLNFRSKEILLKICEDVPKNTYIFIEVTNIGLYEDRFLNRSHLFELNLYNKEELINIIKSFKGDISDTDISKILSMLGSPKDIKECLEFGVEDFYNFINKIINNICKAQTYNSMKICDKLSTKSGDNLISFSLFFDAIINISFKLYKETLDNNMLKLFKCASKYNDDLISCPRVNKKALFDNFILDLHN